MHATDHGLSLYIMLLLFRYLSVDIVWFSNNYYEDSIIIVMVSLSKKKRVF